MNLQGQILCIHRNLDLNNSFRRVQPQSSSKRKSFAKSKVSSSNEQTLKSPEKLETNQQSDTKKVSVELNYKENLLKIKLKYINSL